MKKPVVFVVSSDASLSDSIKDLVDSAGLDSECFPTLQAFLDATDPRHGSCLVLNVESQQLTNHDQRTQIAAACALMPSVLLTDRGDVNMAVHALKAGAVDIVQKPYRDHSLLYRIKKTLL